MASDEEVTEARPRIVPQSVELSLLFFFIFIHRSFGNGINALKPIFFSPPTNITVQIPTAVRLTGSIHVPPANDVTLTVG